MTATATDRRPSPTGSRHIIATESLELAAYLMAAGLAGAPRIEVAANGRRCVMTFTDAKVHALEAERAYLEALADAEVAADLASDPRYTAVRRGLSSMVQAAKRRAG